MKIYPSISWTYFWIRKEMILSLGENITESSRRSSTKEVCLIIIESLGQAILRILSSWSRVMPIYFCFGILDSGQDESSESF